MDLDTKVKSSDQHLKYLEKTNYQRIPLALHSSIHVVKQKAVKFHTYQYIN